MIHSAYHFFQEWIEKKSEQKQEDYDFNIKCEEAADDTIASIEEREEEDESKEVLESHFDCLICHEPFLYLARNTIKICGRPKCR